MTDAAFHMGQELGRAINRMDFFRLFKAMAMKNGFSSFGLLDLGCEIGEFSYVRAARLQGWPEMRLGQHDRTKSAGSDELIRHFYSSTVPAAFTHKADKADLDVTDSILMTLSDSNCAVLVPLHTPTGKRHGLVLLGEVDPPDHAELGRIAYEASVIFQRYYEAILSLDTVTGLTDREIQIVRWTSEGKTSAEIAIILGLSEHTINSYTATVLRKLQVVNRAQMVAAAIRSGLIS